MTKHSTTGNRENPTDNLALELRLQLCASVRVGGFLSAAWRKWLPDLVRTADTPAHSITHDVAVRSSMIKQYRSQLSSRAKNATNKELVVCDEWKRNENKNGEVMKERASDSNLTIKQEKAFEKT